MPPKKKAASSAMVTKGKNDKTKNAMSPEEFYSKLSKDNKSAIANLKDKKIDLIPSGSWIINSIIGDGTNRNKPGGLPRGHIVEVAGDESSGKTTLGLCACRQVQLMGGVPIYMDFERSFNHAYARNLGIDMDPLKFMLIEPEHLEDGAKWINDSLLMKPPLIVVDSVSAMIPKDYLEGNVDEGGRIGLQAQKMSAFLSYITKKIGPSNTCLLFINQMRSVIKTSKYDAGPNEETSGGRAIRYYSSVRIRFQKKKIETVMSKSAMTGKDEKMPVNIMVKATAIKNKIDRPYLTGPLYIRFGEGFDNIYSIMELAINTKVIKQKGAFYSFSVAGEQIFNCQGKEGLRKYLIENKDAFQAVRDGLSVREDAQAKQENPPEEDAEQKGADELGALLDGVSKKFIKKDDEPDEEESV